MPDLCSNSVSPGSRRECRWFSFSSIILSVAISHLFLPLFFPLFETYKCSKYPFRMYLQCWKVTEMINVVEIGTSRSVKSFPTCCCTGCFSGCREKRRKLQAGGGGILSDPCCWHSQTFMQVWIRRLVVYSRTTHTVGLIYALLSPLGRDGGQKHLKQTDWKTTPAAQQNIHLWHSTRILCTVQLLNLIPFTLLSNLFASIVYPVLSFYLSIW